MRRSGLELCLVGTLLLSIFIQFTLQENAFINYMPLSERRLNVSECHEEVDQTGLDCNKEGFFVHSFKKQIPWEHRSEIERLSPVSPAVCCRPDVPNIPQLKISTDVYPLAIVSVGCHVAANEVMYNMACEVTGDSLVTGFVDTFRLKDHQDVEIPERGVICCTPVLLMSTGAVWKLERCNCHTPKQTADGFPTTECDKGQLLWGFRKFKYASHHATPTTPVSCCDLCVGPYYYDTSQCAHLNSCNRHGVCIMGSCECYPDWIGEDCGESKEDYFAEPKFESSIWWLGGLGFIGAFFCLFATFWIIRRTEQEGPQRPANDRGLLGLISSYINDAGSAGSSDTDSTRSLTDEEQHRQETSQEAARASKRGSSADNEAYRPLLQMSCCLCEERPVQVTLVPCGHSNVCRKCSRKLTTCPFCRKTIIRRQRLFLGV